MKSPDDTYTYLHAIHVHLHTYRTYSTHTCIHGILLPSRPSTILSPAFHPTSASAHLVMVVVVTSRRLCTFTLPIGVLLVVKFGQRGKPLAFFRTVDCCTDLTERTQPCRLLKLAYDWLSFLLYFQ